ncbi:hypothetical protein ACJ2CR_18640 [Myxococcus faecalis]|uniref:hypothetical protein n=1 Tax=Myxococcus faecalis TaxID=3115646 RepID=UPI0038CFA571
MLKPHLTRDSAEQYILGALAPEKAAALEAHTLECEPCALLLQEEALLSEQLNEVAQDWSVREERVARPARWHTRRAAAGVAIAALAASLALVLLPGGKATQSRELEPGEVLPPTLALGLEEDLPPTNVVACPDLATQAFCTRKAAERGLLVMTPSGIAEVPRYEARTGLPEGALSARQPVSL